MREDKTEKWKYTKVQKPMIDAFLRESQTKNVFEDELISSCQIGRDLGEISTLLQAGRSGANCPKKTDVGRISWQELWANPSDLSHKHIHHTRMHGHGHGHGHGVFVLATSSKGK